MLATRFTGDIYVAPHRNRFVVARNVGTSLATFASLLAHRPSGKFLDAVASRSRLPGGTNVADFGLRILSFAPGPARQAGPTEADARGFDRLQHAED